MMEEIARVTTFEELVDAMKTRRKVLGMSQMLVDEISGMQGGYTGKLECGDKGLGKVTLPLLLGALGAELVIMPAARQQRGETTPKRENYWSRRGRELRKIQLAKQTPKQRQKIARAAAKARWAKVKREAQS